VVYEDGYVTDLSLDEVRRFMYYDRVPFHNSFSCMKHLVERTVERLTVTADNKRPRQQLY
jgi:hypothetical protein